MISRTPPGVRELKLPSLPNLETDLRRTPPGVRELKQQWDLAHIKPLEVAPLPGCVN